MMDSLLQVRRLHARPPLESTAEELTFCGDALFACHFSCFNENKDSCSCACGMLDNEGHT